MHIYETKLKYKYVGTYHVKDSILELIYVRSGKFILSFD